MKMKKMITSMLVALGCVMGSSAALTAVECSACSATETSCQIWFKGSGKGKISTGSKSQMYKTVKTLKISSCQLVIAAGESNATAKVVLKGKKTGVGDFEKELECSEFVWNVFGKKLEKLSTSKKEVTLDSEMFFRAEDEDGTMEVAGVLTGKVKGKSSGGCGPCGEDATVKWTPVRFSGKFVGWSEATGCACARELKAALSDCNDCTGGCLTFVEPENDPIEVFDGTITLKYESKKSGCQSRIITE